VCSMLDCQDQAMPMFLQKSSSIPQCKGLNEHVCKVSAAAAAAAVNVMFQVGKLACLAGYATSNSIVERIAPLGC